MKLNQYIDHTLLNPQVTREEILTLCAEARAYKFNSVCVNPFWVETVSEELKSSECKTCATIGFPLGANTTIIKVSEAIEAVANGADEVDMVINISAVKNEMYDMILAEINQVCEAIYPNKVSVTIETCLLTDKEKSNLANLFEQSKASCLNTSTGFNRGGALKGDIMLFNSIIKSDKIIKATGGIKSKDSVLSLIEVGASRIGSSISVSIVNDQMEPGRGKSEL